MTACIPNPEYQFCPADSGVIYGSAAFAEGVFRLPTDPLRYVALTFDGVNAGSEIRCYLNSTGAELFGEESCDANHVFSAVPYYGTGQVVTLRIVHPDYRIKEFSYTVPASSQVIPIQQEPDKWYSNP